MIIIEYLQYIGVLEFDVCPCCAYTVLAFYLQVHHISSMHPHTQMEYCSQWWKQSYRWLAVAWGALGV